MEPARQPSEELYAKQVTRAIESAMGRAASAAHADLKHGLNTLATITSIAPFIGIFGTVWAIGFDTFRGVGMEQTTVMAAVAEALSRACMPAALGLLIGLQSLWCYRYLLGRLGEFDLEMGNASLQLTSQLTLRLRHLGRAASIGPIAQSVPYLEKYAATAAEDQRGWQRSAAAALALLGAAWCIQVAGNFTEHALPINLALRAAFRSVAIVFGCSCLPAYAVWVDLLHRKSTGLPGVAAALCFTWCAGELLFPVLRFW